MPTYQVGDLITGGLAWTRPVRLGGVQIRRNFGLRSDLVTMPLPEVSGTAAVPSTVDLYVNSTRRSSHEVPAGPFSISDIPAVSGDATARLVVRDALGRETVTETPLFASADLLAPGLIDYSAEIGFARRNYGLESFNYDERPFGMASARYGLTDRLTLEAHAEAGLDFLNGGAGAAFALGTLGIGTAAVAGSRYGDESGFLV
ncbi:fimbria/pilus outer membrane usher protein [Rhizobium sp. XQZ8]|uniref:fimbria/pilus outer membrane usher protein n=1 Tax=Rhizobium populisoli TaxID=2859785 RepID=UPI001CA57389|nr:fimbria/pilus outer membrane usher protein [Rhizobium populisoli]MBW6424946.1 fimbria/pilus outer membrane usher protein [Rhizobium populisoli]